MTLPSSPEATADQPAGVPAAPPTAARNLPGLDYSRLLECVHCGLCLTACPTFDLLGTEADSPRGRIYQMRALAEGRINLNDSFVKHLDSCLGCRACETACPSGVRYGEVLTPTRAVIEARYPRPRRERLARRFLLFMLTHADLLAAAMFPATLVNRILRGANPLNVAGRMLFGPHAPRMPLPDRLTAVVSPLPGVTPAAGERRARVVLLAGCVMQVLYQRVNEATVRVLSANGCEVVVPSNLGCCGALHMHCGYLDDARARARKLIETLERQEFDALLSNSAGCGSALRDYGELFHNEPRWRQRAEALAARVRDVSEYLTELVPRPPLRQYRRRVAYHDACHLAHGQGVRAQPRELLRSIAGLELVEIEASDHCCGSAGIYNFLEPELATKLQAAKVANILAAQPEVIAMGNPGCHAWIEAGLRRCGAKVEVLHTMEVLDAAYAPPD